MFQHYRNNPTIDIYFRQPLANLITNLPFSRFARPVRRIGPNTFAAGDRAVIVRYITKSELAQLQRQVWDKVYYVIDDDLFNLDNDTSLPDDYRERLQKFTNTLLPSILKLTDTIVSPSPLILEHFHDKETAQLSPAYLTVCDNFDHFKETGQVRALFPGTRSHLADLAAIAPAIEAALDQAQTLTLTTFLGEHSAGVLIDHPRIFHRPAQSWNKFRRTMQNERFHLALVPYRDTPFNRARSINKIHDVAAFGAAGLFSNRPPSSDIVEHGKSGLLLGDEPEAWTTALVDLARNARQMREMAQANAALSKHHGNHDHIRRFWNDRLLLNSSAGPGGT